MAEVQGEMLAELPPMMQPLDVVLKTEKLDLEVIQREFRDGQGKVQVLHNSQLSRSLMSGSFESASSTGGVTKYEGTLLGDPHKEPPLPHGQGMRQNPDGSTYAGQWKDGFPDGRGEWKAPPSSGDDMSLDNNSSCGARAASYVGEWKRGKKQGFGVQIFTNADSYEGDWADGKFQDRGKYTYVNGDVFQGIYDGGVKVSGSFYFEDGRVSTRKWQNGKLISCQDFDSKKRVYNPTILHTQVHAPERNVYGAKALGA